jgi:BirA family biotin operon repressor/biotin-[acetyl-CoA-carboxylase] ligase
MAKKLSKGASDILEPVIEALRSDPKKHFSAKQIAQKIGSADVLVMEAIGGLSIWGYRFEMDNNSHIRFLSAPDSLFPFEILYGLKTKAMGQTIYSHFSVASTMDSALKLAEKDAPEGTLVIAEKQTSGRGRLGRSWHSPPKSGLWFSLILRPPVSPAVSPSLSILSALSLSEALRIKYKIPAMIKWPNDCLVDGRKICGILTELSAELDKVNYIIIGMGINVNINRREFPPELRSIATSVKEEYGEKTNRIVLLRAFLERFEKNYQVYTSKGFKPFLQKVRKYSYLLGRKIKLKQGHKIIQATAIDIDADGALLAKHRNEILRVTAGEVTVV